MDSRLVSNIESFPWKALRAVSKRDIHARKQALGTFPGFADVAETQEALTALLKVPCEISALAIGSGVLAPLFQGIAVEVVTEGKPARSVLVELDIALVHSLISIVTQTPPMVMIGSESMPPPPPAGRICGAAAALVMSVARRSVSKHVPLVLKQAAPAQSSLLDFIEDDEEPVYASYSVVVGDEAHLARVWMRSSGALVPEPPMDLSLFGRAPLGLKVVLVEETMTRAEIAALGRGDVLLLSRKLGYGGDGAPILSGPVTLAAARSEVGLRAKLDGASLIYDGDIVDLDPTARLEQSAMPDERVFGDVPVSVRVEVGTVELAARDWARVRAGDTLTLSKRLGEPVVLRVAGVEVARGELVNVEGEVGVRILEKHTSGSGETVDTQVVP